MSLLDIILYSFLFVVCLALSAFFASSETAYISLHRARAQQMLDQKVPGAERVVHLISRPDKLLSTVLLGNNLVNTAAAAIGTTLAIQFLGTYGLIVSTVVVTVFLLIVCDTTPKTLAAQHSERLALMYARPMGLVSRLFYPFVLILAWVSSKLSLKLGGKPVLRSLATEDEIRAMISLGHKEGTVEPEEAQMLHRVFDFGDRPAREVMMPRPEVVAIEQGSNLGNFLELYTAHPLSRFPVYKENMDNVVGTLSVKDALMALARGTPRDSSIDDLVRPAYFAPESKSIRDIFREMQEKNYHMCVVVDEYGGTAGVVSLARLIEEIVGEVGDEMADFNKEYEIINEHTFQIDGSMRVDEANTEMGLGLPEGEYETVAGFILNLIGHIPRENENLRYRNLKIHITEMRGPKIVSVRITREAPPPAAVPPKQAVSKVKG